jgi:tetratricopeptide (TPR) repeat protein
VHTFWLQRFPKGVEESGHAADHFRSARRAPNERVRNSVKSHPMTVRIDPPAVLSEKPPRHEPSLSPPKRRPGDGSLSFGPTVVDPASVSGVGVPGDANPFRVGTPQRVEPPKDLNTPVREHDDTAHVDELDLKAKEEAKAEHGRIAPAAAVTAKDFDPSVSRRHASMTKVQDQKMLAFACRRANKTRNEALAYYNMGVLHDNDKEYEKANQCYEQYLQAARAAGDTKGEQLALNSIGINCYRLRSYEAAVDAHSQHNAIADVPGKFVAHCNLGLAYAQMGDLEKASLNHRQALRYAIVMASLVGESLACGNLGMVAMRMKDARTAKACLERHLKLSTALKDMRAQLEAKKELGELANTEGEYLEAATLFEEAHALALELKDIRTSEYLRCMIGVARGNAQYDEIVESMASALEAAAEADWDENCDEELPGPGYGLVADYLSD